MILRRITILLICSFSLSGCLSTKHTDQTILQAKQFGFKQCLKNTSVFKITTFEKIDQPDGPLVFYLEGDGHSMATRYTLSKDPTPHQPLGLELALLDKRPNVIYIARPCQYTPHATDPNCSSKYWSTHRFSKEVIESTSEVIGHYLKKNKPQQIHLIGFSSGGGLSILVASIRNDITSITTVAGDLNIKMMEALHKTTPQVGSLDPIKYANKLKMNQLHLSGGKDLVVPPKIAESFVMKSTHACVKHQVLDNFSHHKGWAKAWPNLLDEMPCQDV